MHSKIYWRGLSDGGLERELKLLNTRFITLSDGTQWLPMRMFRIPPERAIGTPDPQAKVGFCLRLPKGSKTETYIATSCLNWKLGITRVPIDKKVGIYVYS